MVPAPPPTLKSPAYHAGCRKVADFIFPGTDEWLARPLYFPLPRETSVSAIRKAALATAIEFVDIAGLVKGASQGEGLGNQFLSHIREVDAIVQVVRCFENEDIHHVAGTMDPVRDIEVINTELILADMAALEKRKDKLAKNARGGDAQAKA